MSIKETAKCLEFMHQTVYDMVTELSKKYTGYTGIDVNGDAYTVKGVYLNSTGKLCCTIENSDGVYETLFEWIN